MCISFKSSSPGQILRATDTESASRLEPWPRAPLACSRPIASTRDWARVIFILIVNILAPADEAGRWWSDCNRLARHPNLAPIKLWQLLQVAHSAGRDGAASRPAVGRQTRLPNQHGTCTHGDVVIHARALADRLESRVRLARECDMN